MRVSVIATVKNEETSIGALLDSLLSQSLPPDEIVIVDGGSTDQTAETIQAYASRGAPVRLLVREGTNISQGRNAAIQAATGEVIAATDAGVALSHDWLAELVRPFQQPAGADAVGLGAANGGAPGRPVDVVSGFFQSAPRTVFELALGATVLPILEEIDPDRFLPSSRSVAFRRQAWEEVGGYPEWLDYCEDVKFGLDLRGKGYHFAFAPGALAHFRPRTTLRAFFVQYYRYARGDGKAGLWPRRHAIRYASYALGPIVFLTGFWYKLAWLALALAVVGYLWRPYHHLLLSLRGAKLSDRLLAFLWVPAIRLVGDVAKMVGYPVGLVWRWRRNGDA